MNIEQAKRVPLSVILNILGQKQTQQKNADDTDVVTYVCRYLESRGESCRESDAVRWITNMTGMAPRIEPVDETDRADPVLYVGDKKTLSHPLLIREIEARGIPLSVAQRYQNEVRIYGGAKLFSAIGFRNEVGGWLYRTPFNSGFIGKMDISFIRGAIVKPDSIHIFQTDLDFMSAMVAYQNGKHFDADVLIINSLSCLTKATPYIRGYGYKSIHTWLDNSTLGKNATLSLGNFCRTEDSLIHMPMNAMYAPYLNVNAWHMKNIGLV